jgi:hypothetical protein
MWSQLRGRPPQVEGSWSEAGTRHKQEILPEKDENQSKKKKKSGGRELGPDFSGGVPASNCEANKLHTIIKKIKIWKSKISK